MSQHDDSHNPLDAHMTAFGNSLGAANSASGTVTRGRRARPTGRRRGFAIGGATVGAAALASAAVVFAPTGSRLDVIADAQAALEQPGKIVHYLVASQSSGPGPAGSQERKYCTEAPAEIWRTTSGPLRWRLKLPEAVCGVTTGPGGRVYAAGQELSYADGVRTSYSPGGRPWQQQETGVPVRSADVPHYASALLEETAGSDPVAAMRRLLASGELKDIGEIEARGGTVRRLVGDGPALPDGSMAPSELKDMNITYDVDPETFAPVTIELVLPKPHLYSGDDPERLKQWMAERNTITLEFTGYELLPLTAENEAVLAAPIAPGTETLPATTWQQGVDGKLPRLMRQNQNDANRQEFSRVVRERHERQAEARRADGLASTTP